MESDGSSVSAPPDKSSLLSVHGTRTRPPAVPPFPHPYAGEPFALTRPIGSLQQRHGPWTRRAQFSPDIQILQCNPARCRFMSSLFPHLLRLRCPIVFQRRFCVSPRIPYPVNGTRLDLEPAHLLFFPTYPKEPR